MVLPCCHELLRCDHPIAARVRLHSLHSGLTGWPGRCLAGNVIYNADLPDLPPDFIFSAHDDYFNPLLTPGEWGADLQSLYQGWTLTDSQLLLRLLLLLRWASLLPRHKEFGVLNPGIRIRTRQQVTLRPFPAAAAGGGGGPPRAL